MSNPIKAFDAELASVLKTKPPISQKKIASLLQLAFQNIKYYKFVVHSVEKFITKARSEYKVPGVYIIDSIVRHSRHKYGEKDVYGPRFMKNFATTFQNLFKCSVDQQEKVRRVVQLWKEQEIFPAEVCDSVLAEPDEGVTAVMDLTVSSAGADADAADRVPSPPMPDIEVDDFDYGENDDDAERLAEQRRRVQEEEKRAETLQEPAGGLAPTGSGLIDILRRQRPGMGASKTDSVASELVNAIHHLIQQAQRGVVFPPALGTGGKFNDVLNQAPPISAILPPRRETVEHQQQLAAHEPGHAAAAPPGLGMGAAAMPGGNAAAADPGAMPSGGPTGPQPIRVTVLSTTVYLGGLPPTFNEPEMVDLAKQITGTHDPVKIRTDGKRINGFVNFTSRQMAQKFADAMRQTPYHGASMRVGWGKGRGQMEHADAWQMQEGVCVVDASQMNPQKLRAYCDGCVIDRATAPPDLLADLDRLPNAPYYNSNEPDGGRPPPPQQQQQQQQQQQAPPRRPSLQHGGDGGPPHPPHQQAHHHHLPPHSMQLPPPAHMPPPGMMPPLHFGGPGQGPPPVPSGWGVPLGSDPARKRPADHELDAHPARRSRWE